MSLPSDAFRLVAVAPARAAAHVPPAPLAARPGARGGRCATCGRCSGSRCTTPTPCPDADGARHGRPVRPVRAAGPRDRLRDGRDDRRDGRGRPGPRLPRRRGAPARRREPAGPRRARRADQRPGRATATRSTWSAARCRTESLDAVHVFFPDPWPKARHHKRRLVQPSHVALLRSRLRGRRDAALRDRLGRLRRRRCSRC